ncbi:MAG: response regulator [Clostridia bacterium]|nr:response regulator [Clostridia bacterium]
MKSIIIVDDELTIRKGIASFLEKYDKYVILDICQNGKEAYYSTIKNNPDIVITDVKMPMMDGLTFIEKCKHLNTKFLILSGYDEFNYMKKAHLLNVVEDYLLKPIDNHELITSLDKIAEKIDLNAKEDAFINNLLGHIFVEDTFLSPQVYNVLENKYGIDIASIQILLISADFSKCGITDCITKAKEYIEKYLLQTIKSNFLIFIKKQKIVIITSKYNIVEKNIPQFLKTLLIKIKNKFQLDIVVGVSSPSSDVTSFEKLYYNTLLSLTRKIYKTDKRILFQNVYWFDMDEKELNNLFSKEKKLLFEYLKEHKLIECKDLMKHIFEKLDNERIPPYAMFVLVKDLQLFFERLFSGRNISKISSGLMEIETDIEKVTANIFMHTKKQIEEMIYQSIEELNNYLIEKNKKTGNIIEDVINYINVYYMEDITLDTICNNFYINASYFSKIFKERTGMNYNKYLTDVRIAKSKNLLSSTNLKVFEISKIVGYNDPKYFSKVFKENTNLSPAEYKKTQI